MTLSGAGGGGSTGGGKGGSGAARTPVTDKDNLRSTQYASLVDVLCEGEIEGLVNGNKSIYLNDTPIQNPDNSYNFDNVTVYAKTGTQSQDAIPIASEIASEKSVGVAVTQATPIVRTITNPDVDAVRITISVPQLQMIEDDGDITGSLFQIDIDVQYNGGGYQTKINEWVKGRTGDPWTRDYRVELNGAFPVDIRVSRENPDSNNPKITNAFTWQSYTEITYAKLAYPNTALVGLRVDAGQFSSIPSRKYRIRGRKIKLPSNATVDNTTYRGRVTYSGVWDGTFGAAQYSNDPAWCLWDLLHSSRAGFGDHIKVTDSDKWAFYAASQYCRELVPNGLGGMEPRFACNVNIQTQQDAYKLINDLCSVFRAMPFWAAGTLGLTQDRPADPAFLFNQSNVIDGIFNYSSSSQKNRPTVVTAGYFDLDTRDVAYETVESQALIEQYGVVRKEIEAVATTSRGQARRVAEWMLYSEWNEPEVVAFKTSVDAGVMVRPGMVIEIADPARAGVRHGGRIVSATQTTVVLDSAEGLPASMTGCELTLIMPTGIAETRPIASRSGATLTFAAGSGFTASANPLSPWNLSEPTVQTQLWRVLGLKEADGIEYAITAIAHNPSKYAYIELDKPLEERDITNLNETPAAPASVSVEEVMYVERARARTKLVVSWTAVAGVTSYVLRWRLDAGNWEQLEVETNSGDVLDSKAGTYEIEVLSIGANLKRSTTATATTFAAEGNSRPPATPSGLVLTTVDVRILLLRWAAPEPDVIYGGIVQVRHSPLTTGASWTSSSTVLEVDGGALQAELPAMTGTYLVKFRDSAGNWSTSAASIASIYATPGGRVTVLTLNEISDYNKPVPFVSGPFSSRKDGVTVSGGALSLASGSLTGTYYLGTLNRSTTSPLYGQDVIDLGTVEDIYIKEAITATLPDGVTAQLFVSTTDGSGADPYQLSLASPQYTLVPPALQPAWTDWREAKNNYVRGRCFRFKLMLTRTSAAVNASITAYSIDLQMQTRTAGGNQTAATLAYNPINGITLPQYFPVPDSPFSGFHYAIDLSPSFIQITGGTATATGMTAQVQPSTVYGKNIAYIQFRNTSNQITTPATFTWTVTGYGAENGTPIVSDDNSGAMTPAQMRKLDGLTPGTAATNIVQLDTAAKLPAVDGSQLLNVPGGSFTQGGTGAVTQTVQAKLQKILDVRDFGATGNGTTDDTAAFTAAGSTAAISEVRVPRGTYRLNSNPNPVAPGGGAADVTWIVEHGASFVGTGTLTKITNKIVSTGAFRTLQSSSSFYGGIFGYLEQNAALSVSGGLGIHGSARTGLGSGTGGEAYIGVSGFAANDYSGGVSGTWALYGTAIRRPNAWGPTHGLELDIANMAGDEIQLFPGAMFAGGQTHALWLCTGGEATNSAQVGIASVAIGIIQNDSSATKTAKFEKGIVFHNQAIKGTDGATGVGIAMGLATGHQMIWFNNSNQAIAEIVCTNRNIASDAAIDFSQFGIIFRSRTNARIGFIIQTDNLAVNYLSSVPSRAGLPTRLKAYGNDTDVDIFLDTQGAGVIRFGTQTVVSGTPSIVRYITIKDYAGNTCKLAVIA